MSISGTNTPPFDKAAALDFDLFNVPSEGTSDLPFWLCRFPCNRALI